MISVAAQLAGVHPQALRAYEQKGSYRPSARAATPACSPADIERRLINELTSEGILAGVIRILDLRAPGGARHELATCTSACAVWPIACTA
ncbi:MAG: hypothetical protein ACLTMP_14285 [Eggerthella lenta]